MSFINGGGTLEIKLLSYSNPKGEDINGGVCDIWQRSRGCDHKFEFCLKENDSCVMLSCQLFMMIRIRSILKMNQKIHYTFALKVKIK